VEEYAATIPPVCCTGLFAALGGASSCLVCAGAAGGGGGGGGGGGPGGRGGFAVFGFGETS
jgi:hypothetical protein